MCFKNLKRRVRRAEMQWWSAFISLSFYRFDMQPEHREDGTLSLRGIFKKGKSRKKVIL